MSNMVRARINGQEGVITEDEAGRLVNTQGVQLLGDARPMPTAADAQRARELQAKVDANRQEEINKILGAPANLSHQELTQFVMQQLTREGFRPGTGRGQGLGAEAQRRIDAAGRQYQQTWRQHREELNTLINRFEMQPQEIIQNAQGNGSSGGNRLDVSRLLNAGAGRHSGNQGLQAEFDRLAGMLTDKRMVERLGENVSLGSISLEQAVRQLRSAANARRSRLGLPPIEETPPTAAGDSASGDLFVETEGEFAGSRDGAQVGAQEIGSLRFNQFTGLWEVVTQVSPTGAPSWEPVARYDPEMAQALSGFVNVRERPDGTLEFLSSSGGWFSEDEILTPLGSGAGATGGSAGAAGGGQGQDSTILRPAWWPTGFEWPPTKSDPFAPGGRSLDVDGINDVFRLVESGAFGPELQRLASQQQPQGRGETFRDPNTGRTFIRQPDGTIEDLPEQRAPSLDDQISQAVLERRFDDTVDANGNRIPGALTLQRFANQATPQQKLEGALAYARSPADFFTLSQARAETLEWFNQPGQPGRIGPQADFLQDAANAFFGQADFSSFQGQAQSPFPAFNGDPNARVRESQDELADIRTQQEIERRAGQTVPTEQTNVGRIWQALQAAGINIPLGRVASLPSAVINFLDGFAQRGQVQAAVQELMNQGVLTSEFFSVTPGAAGQVEPGTGQLATSSTLNPQQQEILRQQQAGEITGHEARLRFQELARFPSGGGGFVSSPASFTQQAMSSGGSIGPSGLLTTPRLENLIQGNAQGRPNSLLSFAGLRPLSAQAISRSSPSELGMFREIGRLAGIPDDDFEQEMRAGIPFSSNASQAHSPIRRRQQRRSFV